jgi:PAS domain-containing protein/two-component sensor histidine kinase
MRNFEFFKISSYKTTFPRLVLLVIIFSIGGGIVYYIDKSLNQSDLENRNLILAESQQQVAYQFKSSILEFKIIVSGIKSFLSLSPNGPDNDLLESYIRRQLKYSNYSKDLIISFIDTTHTFQFVFTRNEYDPAGLVGTSVKDLLSEEKIEALNKLFETDELLVFDPILTKEGWVGLPIDFSVKKNGLVIGYIAVILNLEILFNEINNNIIKDKFTLKITTENGFSLNRSSHSSNADLKRKFPILSFRSKSLDIYDQKFTIDLAFNKNYEHSNIDSVLLMGWYVSLAIFALIGYFRWIYVNKINISLKNNIKFIEKIAKLSPSHIYIFDVDTLENTYENKNLQKYLGFTPDSKESMPKFLRNNLHPQDLILSKKRLKKHLKLEGENTLDTTIRLKDAHGDWKWFLGKEVIFKKNADGSAKEVLGIANDVTSLKRIEYDLLNSERNLKTAQEISKIGHWEIDLHTGKSEVSDSFHNIFGIKSKSEKLKLEENGSRFQKYIHRADIGLVFSNYKTGLKTGKQHALDYRIFKGKETKYIHSIVNFIMGEKGKPIKAWGTIQDITKRKHAEQLLLIQNDELEKINIELDRFVYRVTHDLKGPLNNMTGLVKLTKEEKDMSAREEYLTMMNTSIDKMVDFIHDLVSYVKNSNLDVQNEEMDLKVLLEEVISEHRHIKEAVKIDFDIKFSGGTTIYSDYSRLRIVFNNLVSNAIKYHDLSKDDPYVTISVGNKNNQINAEVTDNGSGMELEDSDKIFDMFYRAAPTAQTTAGSGIGLFILSEALKKLGGAIQVSSIKGQGSTFTVNFPANQQ